VRKKAFRSNLNRLPEAFLPYRSEANMSLLGASWTSYVPRRMFPLSGDADICSSRADINVVSTDDIGTPIIEPVFALTLAEGEGIRRISRDLKSRYRHGVADQGEDGGLAVSRRERKSRNRRGFGLVSTPG
jgi:hypothetical protein